MVQQENKSEVVRILQHIQMEYESAERALKGMAVGTARHDFINAKMDNMGQASWR